MLRYKNGMELVFANHALITETILKDRKIKYVAENPYE